MEPFSTSVFKVLTWIFATTTKICTDDSSISSYELTSTLIVATPLLAAIRRLRKNANLYRQRTSMGKTLERHPFSGLVDSAGELLHTP